MAVSFQKFSPPNLPGNLLQRPVLESFLMKGLQEKARLFLITAPAGYGKSTLIANWISKNHIKHIWLNLDPTDSDLPKLIFAIQQTLGIAECEDKGISSKQVEKDYQSTHDVNIILESINQLNKTFLLIFDRLDEVDSNKTQDFIYSLSTQLPAHAACVVISRKNTSLPISRMRAHSQLVELNERDLRFTSKEIRLFVEKTSGVLIDTNNLDVLTRKTSGWVAGLRLAIDLLGKQLAIPNSLTVNGLSGSQRFIADYFNEEIYSKIDKSLRKFMANCSVLGQFSARLCQSVLEDGDIDHFIRTLTENRLFIIEIEGRQGWFEFHPLFSDYLTSKCGPDEKRALNRKAALWFQQQDQLDIAVDYSLKSGDEQIALEIIEPVCEKAILDGEIETITTWLEKWARNGFQKRAELLVYQGWIMALQGNFVQAQILNERAGEILKSQYQKKNKGILQSIQITQGKMAALQAFIEVMYTQRYDTASKAAKQALKLLPKNRSAWNLMALWAQAETQKRIDHIGKSIETLYEALRMGKSTGGKVFYYAVVNSLAAALYFSGRRTEAIGVCSKTIARSTDPEEPLLGGIYSWTGRLHLEANQVEEALDHIQTGMRLNELNKASLNLLFSYYYASQIYQADGQSEKAMELIHHAQSIASNASLSDESWLNAWEANLNFMQGNYIQVEHWIRRQGQKLDEKLDYLNMEMMIVHARYLIRQGDLNNAIKRLQKMERFASKRGYYRWLLTIYLLQAIVWNKKQKKAQSLESVKRALHIAAPEEYQRAFLDEDPVILNLVQELSNETPAFIMRLLRSAASQDKHKKQIPASILPEPLSDRETQVLRLLASGKKGPQIANELFIAYSTVRTHLKSIHRKLDVHNRQELLDKVRLLELI